MSAVCVGHFGSLAGAGWLLTVPGCWLARLKQLLVGRLGVCGDTLLILLVPFFFFLELKWASGSVAGNMLQSCR